MEHAVLVHLPLRQGQFGAREERHAIFALEDQVMRAVGEASAGKLDGHEFGDGACVLFLYGPDADRLYAVIEPLLKTAPAAAGGYAIKRYGEAGDSTAPEVRVSW